MRPVLAVIAVMMVASCSLGPLNGATRITFVDTEEAFWAETELRVVDGFVDSVKLRIVDSQFSPQELAVLGLPADDSWVLLRVTSWEQWAALCLHTELWNRVGRWAPKSHLVNARVGSAPSQLWALSETPNRSDARLDLKKLLPEEQQSGMIGGGYIFRLSSSSALHDVKITYPDGAGIAERTYLGSYLLDLQTSTAPETLIEYEAFADAVLINSLAGWRAFVDFTPMFAKDRGSRVVPVPVADARGGFYGDALVGLEYTIPSLQRVWGLPDFRQTLGAQLEVLTGEDLGWLEAVVTKSAHEYASSTGQMVTAVEVTGWERGIVGRLHNIEKQVLP